MLADASTCKGVAANAGKCYQMLASGCTLLVAAHFLRDLVRWWGRGEGVCWQMLAHAKGWRQILTNSNKCLHLAAHCLCGQNYPRVCAQICGCIYPWCFHVYMTPDISLGLWVGTCMDMSMHVMHACVNACMYVHEYILAHADSLWCRAICFQHMPVYAPGFLTQPPSH